ncbi:helix-turn-helix domain-containing protein [Companilactobacillus sp. HBUAS59699]|uniref:helix-turn-helix domain-containing protein n=1 Tax=Companilactobacillus sp. HBUAS59699 TaxID=3109358 RepID=UPI002FF14402
MAIVRAKRKTNFTIIGNTGLKDKRLSLKAKGLLAYMLSLPDDWTFYETELMEHSKDGRDSVRKGLQELEKSGYLVRFQKREGKGKFGPKDWKVYDEPDISTISPQTENPSTDNPLSGNPLSDNPTLLSTNEPSTDKQNTNSNSPKSKTYDETDDNYQLASYFVDKIRENNPEFKEPNMQKWSNSIRLMHERDNRDYSKIKKMIEWSQSDDFWSVVVLSPDKLRKQYDQMAMQANREFSNKKNHRSKREKSTDWGKYESNISEEDATKKQKELQERLKKMRSKNKNSSEES